MKVFANLWGGEGFLTSASLLAMASVGMFENVQDGGTDMKLFYRCLDFTSESPDDIRWKNIKDAMEKYYPLICRNNLSIEYDNCSISDVVHFETPENLVGKFKDMDKLAIGCSEADMEANIRKGIYGKPWVGEAYHSDSYFGNLYEGKIDNNESVIVINCGGYKGGGTAATFIPLENGYPLENAERYNVIAGPSTNFSHNVKIPNPAIYARTGIPSEVDLFEIPEIIRKLESQPVMGASENIHRQNIEYLKNEYRKVCDPTSDPPFDYSNLNPALYMGRFIDRLRSDSTMNSINASFINIKANCIKGNSFNYDSTCDVYMPDNQDHKIHITNMLNAVTIKEIMMNHSAYSNHQIYSFCSPNTDKFTIDGVFLPDDVLKLYRFIILSVILTKYVYSYFDNINKPGADVMLSKWAKQIKLGMFKGYATATDNDSDAGRQNNQFANAVKNRIKEIAYEYLKPVLKVFKNVEDTSDDTAFFSRNNGGEYDIITNLENIIHDDRIDSINDPNVIKQQTEQIIAILIMGKKNYSNDFQTVLTSITTATNAGNDFLSIYQSRFPEFGRIDKNHREWPAEVNGSNLTENAVKYADQVISYTYNSIMENLL